MARRRSLLRRSGRLVLDLPEIDGPPDAPRRRRWRWLRVTVLVLLGLFALSSAAAYGFVTAITTNLPDLSQFDASRAEPPQDGSIWVKGENGAYRQIAKLRSTESRVIVRSDEISQAMKDATVAVEDKRFYDHNGVDLPGIARAIVRRVTVGTNEGASTITQQLVKNTYLTNQQTVERKVREASLAWQLEQRWSKDRILTAYLNTVYFGHNTYGVESAARFYFDKSAAELDPADSALLAAILKSPVTFDPINNPDNALARRNVVLRQMGEQGFLDPDTVAVEQGRRLLPVARADREPEPETEQPYWVQYITEQLVNKFGTGRTFGGGLKVYTTLDLREQAIAEQALGRTLPKTGPQGAIVVIEPGTGEVLAMAGGKPYSRRHQFNVAANARRQPGSAFKPFVYLAALEQGIRPDTTFESKRVLYDLGGGQFWFVTNDEPNYGEYMNLPQATAVSDNTVFAQLTMLVKPPAIAEMAGRMGITTPINEGQPAIGLGGLYIGVSPVEMAQAYATLANDGQRIGGSILFHTPDSGITDSTMDPISIARIEFPDGTELVNSPKAVQAVSEEDALTVTQALQGVVDYGTARSIEIGRPAAGKTGTTTDYKDAWFVGYTPDRVASVWVGYENPALPMKDEYDGRAVAGGTFPADIWEAYMVESLEDVEPSSFGVPTGVGSTTVSIDPRTGRRVPPDCAYAQFVVLAYTAISDTVEECADDLAPVPDFGGLTKARAVNLSIGSGLQVRFERRPAGPTDEPGRVVAQTPEPLDALPVGSVVTLVLAQEVPNVLVPGVIAAEDAPSTTEAAIARLEAAGFRVIVQDQQDAVGLPLGSVVNQSPSSGEPAPRGSVVTLWVSGTYDEGVIVPSVDGQEVQEAERRLAAAGLTSRPINAEGPLRPQDKVFRADPAAGSKVPPGTAVTLSVAPF